MLGLALVELAVSGASGSAGGSWRRPLAWLTGGGLSVGGEAELLAVLRSWAFLTPHVREVAIQMCAGRWLAIADQVSTDRDPAVRLAIAEIAGIAGDPALVPAVGRLLRDPLPEVARAADHSFAILLRDQSVSSPGAPTEIEQSFADALRTSATVRATDVARAVAALMDRAAMAKPDSPLAAFINDPATDLTPIQATLRRARDPLTRQRAWEWLARPRLSAACVDSLANMRQAEEHGRVFSLWHLLGNPARATRLKLIRVRSVARAADAGDESGNANTPANSLPQNSPCPAPAELAGLALEARRGFPKYLARLDADGPARVLLTERYLADPDPLARLAAVVTAPSRLLGDFCFDPDPCVSRTAALRRSALVHARLGGSTPDQPDVAKARMATLARAPHAWVRRIHAEDSLPAFADVPAVRLRWRRLLASDRGRVIELLRSAIIDDYGSHRAAAIMLTRRLSLTAALEPELMEVASTERRDLRAAASAVAALGQHPEGAARAVLTECTAHADNRVRANAVEGLAALLRGGHGAEIEGRLVELKADANHRVRANALRPLVAESANQADELCRMMRDARAGHRLAGVWLASRLIAGEHAAQLGRRGYDVVVELKRCAEDVEPAIRRRAAFALEVIGDRGEDAMEVAV